MTLRLLCMMRPSQASTPHVRLFASASNGTSAVYKSRRSVSAFEPTLPTDFAAKLGAAIDCARFAPNHKKTEPWTFHLLGPKATELVHQAVHSLVAGALSGNVGGVSQTPSLAGTDREPVPVTPLAAAAAAGGGGGGAGGGGGGGKLARWKQVPALVVLTCPRSPDNAVRDAEDFAACCCAAQNMMLALWEQGLATKWVTGSLVNDPSTPLLSILASHLPHASAERQHELRDSSKTRIVGVFWIGIPRAVPPAPAKKRALDDVLQSTE
jgi:nitroreductase